jgi:hypothetical protein
LGNVRTLFLGWVVFALLLFGLGSLRENGGIVATAEHAAHAIK